MRINRFVPAAGLCAIAFLSSSTLVAASKSVPYVGTYVADKGNYSIEIQSANPGNGEIMAVYVAKNCQAGPIKVSGQIGNYSWVYNKQAGKDGVAPFGIRFAMSVRPKQREYNIYDTWTGAYQTDNNLLLSGARSYVDSEGVIKVKSLGTKTFVYLKKLEKPKYPSCSINPPLACTKDINECGHPSDCLCPALYIYNPATGKCDLQFKQRPQKEGVEVLKPACSLEPFGACTRDINICGNPSYCQCPTRPVPYKYNPATNKCDLVKLH